MNEVDLNLDYCLYVMFLVEVGVGEEIIYMVFEVLVMYVFLFQCFGLLGVNGVGKISIFKMLMGDIFVILGEVFVDGYR